MYKKKKFTSRTNLIILCVESNPKNKQSLKIENSVKTKNTIFYLI